MKRGTLGQSSVHCILLNYNKNLYTALLLQLFFYCSYPTVDVDLHLLRGS